MTTQTTVAAIQIQNASWIIMSAVGAVALLAGLYVLFATPGGEDTFTGLYAAGFSLLSLIIVLTAYRSGQPWAWAAMWLPAVVYGITAATMLVNRSSVGYTYLAYAALNIVGLLIPIRRVLG